MKIAFHPDDVTVLARPSRRHAITFGLVFFVGAVLLVLAAYAAVWGLDSLRQAERSYGLWIAAAFIASFYAHEYLHVLGFQHIGGAPGESVGLIVDWKELDFRVVCAAPVRAASFRVAAVLPAIVLGFVPTVLSLVFGWGALAIFAALSLGACQSDVLALWTNRHHAGAELVAMLSKDDRVRLHQAFEQMKSS